MPKYFCEYCGIYLTHSSPLGRYQHSHGRKHINNKIEYYSQFLYDFQQNAYKNLLSLTSRYLRKPMVINNKPINVNNINQINNINNTNRENKEINDNLKTNEKNNIDNNKNDNNKMDEEENNTSNDIENDIIIKDITEKN